MKRLLLIAIACAGLAAMLAVPHHHNADAQSRSIYKDSINFEDNLTGDTVRIRGMASLTLTWVGSVSTDTVWVEALDIDPKVNGTNKVAIYDPMTDATDSIIVRSGPKQTVYLYDQRNREVFIRRGTLKANANVVAVWE